MEKLYTVKDLREMGFGRDKAYQLMHNKAFPAIKLGGRYYVTPEAFEKWLHRQEHKEVVL